MYSSGHIRLTALSSTPLMKVMTSWESGPLAALGLDSKLRSLGAELYPIHSAINLSFNNSATAAWLRDEEAAEGKTILLIGNSLLLQR